jgi:arabinose operon protein AraL
LRQYEGYLLDLDGTIYLGEELVSGADRAVALLRERGAKVLFLSNKPIARRETYAAKLTGLGVPAKPEDVINSPLAAARYLSRYHPEARTYVLGERALIDELVAAGLHLTEAAEDTDIVLVSWDRQLTYDRLDGAHQALMAGARFFATNPDVTCPLEGGRRVPDSGANIAALEATTGRKLEVMIGKPSSVITEMALAELGLGPSECLMVGDRLETDMAMGAAAGLDTALVLTGVTRRQDLECACYSPTYVLESIADLA